jgi:hypothetical protein
MERLSIKSLTTGAGVVIAAIGVMAVKAIPFAGGYVAGHEIVRAMQPSPHDQLIAGISNITLPKRLDDITVLTAMRVEGMTVVSTHDLDVTELTADDRQSLQAALTERVCTNEATHKGVVSLGVSYRYEYMHNGVNLGDFDVTSCPA